MIVPSRCLSHNDVVSSADLIAALVTVEAAWPLAAHAVEEAEHKAGEDEKDHRTKSKANVISGKKRNAGLDAL